MCNWKKVFGFTLLLNFSTLANALDVETFNKLANDTIKQMNMGVVGDIDAMIAIQEQLMVIGLEGGIDFLQKGAKNPRPLMLVLENAEHMKELSLDEIEHLWHAGNFLKSKGIDPDKIDHFGPMMSLMDTVIHPATSYLLIKEYKRTGDADLLVRVKAELFEVLEHVKHINPGHQDVQLSSNE